MSVIPSAVDAPTAAMIALIGSLADNKSALGRRYGEWAVSAPTIESAVAGLAAEDIAHITVVPLFLAQGGHLKQDLPRLLDDIRRQYPSLRIDVTPAIGDSQDLTNAIADWAFAQHSSRSR